MVIEEKYKIRDGESEEDFQIRICGYHDTDKLTWTDIANIINTETDQSYSESKYRKWFAMYSKGLKDAENGTSPIELSDEDNEIRERVQTSTEKIPYYRLMRQDSRFERFYKMVAEQIKQLPPPDNLYIKNQDLNLKPNTNSREYVLSLADLHIGASFEGINNTYSIAIVKQRFELLLEKIEEFVTEHHIETLKVISLGDIIQGMLRISDLKLNEAPVVDAFVFACRILADFLNKLSRFCYVEFLQVCYSNHDQLRPLGTKASELSHEDMGKVLFAYLTDTLALNDRIVIKGDVTKDYYEFKIFDFECIAFHGHQVNNLATIAKDLSNKHRKFYDYVFLAHSHSAKELIDAEGKSHDIETLVAPSFVGSCPYADRLMVGSKAACKIFRFDKKYGHDASFKIILN